MRTDEASPVVTHNLDTCVSDASPPTPVTTGVSDNIANSDCPYGGSGQSKWHF